MRTLAALALVLCFAGRSSPAAVADPAPEIQRIMQARFDAGDFNGSVLVARAGRIVYERGFGFANLEWSIP